MLLFQSPMGQEMHYGCDGETPDLAEIPTSTGATGKKKPNR